MKTRYLCLNTLLLFLLVLCENIYGTNHYTNPLGGITVTPTSYIVTMKQIDFRDTGGTWHTFASGGEPFDIASVVAGGTVGNFGAGGILPVGTYNGMRVTIARTFTITAFTTNVGDGSPARTNTGNSTTTLMGVSGLGVASTDGGTAMPQTVPIPYGTNMQSDNMEEIGTTDIRFTMVNLPPFTVSTVGNQPVIQFIFDLTGAVGFTKSGGQTVILPFGPHVNMTINGIPVTPS